MSGRLINAAGAWTGLGASPVDAAIVAAVADVLARPVRIEALQAAAADAMRDAFGVEDGHVTACAASGLVMAVAACMTRGAPTAFARLPDTAGLPSRVVIQRAHCCDFGAPVVQMIRLAGAQVVEIGAVNRCTPDELDAALAGDGIAAALFVASYETAPGGAMPLTEFVTVARARGVPVILDIAGQTDFAPFLSAGADLVIVSGHKALGGPTAGLLMGRADLVAAARQHDRGICRPMKVGKEGIAGATAAIHRWQDRATDLQARWQARVDQLAAGLDGVPGIAANSFKYADGITGTLCRVAFAAVTGIDRTRALARLERNGIVARPGLDDRSLLLSPLALADDEVPVVIDAILKLLVDGEER